MTLLSYQAELAQICEDLRRKMKKDSNLVQVELMALATNFFSFSNNRVFRISVK